MLWNESCGFLYFGSNICDENLNVISILYSRINRIVYCSKFRSLWYIIFCLFHFLRLPIEILQDDFLNKKQIKYENFFVCKEIFASIEVRKIGKPCKFLPKLQIFFQKFCYKSGLRCKNDFMFRCPFSFLYSILLSPLKDWSRKILENNVTLTTLHNGKILRF